MRSNLVNIGLNLKNDFLPTIWDLYSVHAPLLAKRDEMCKIIYSQNYKTINHE